MNIDERRARAACEALRGTKRLGCRVKDTPYGEAIPMCLQNAQNIVKPIRESDEAAGLRVVPYEPTDKMVNAGFNVYATTVLLHEGVKWGYQPMLDAAKGES